MFSSATAAWLASEDSQILALLRKRADFLPHYFGRGQFHAGMLLGIDELKHPNHFVLLILHGKNQHGLGAIAELLVKIAVEPERQIANAVGRP